MASSVWLLISQNGIWFTEIYWWYDLEIWWWLRSTTGPYGRPELEAAYGETAISLHRGCLGDVSSGRVVGVSTWCITHGRHTQVNTSVGTLYVFWFLIQNLYVLYFQRSICIMKGHWWFLTLSWLDDDQGTFLTTHDVFLKKLKIHRFIVIVSLKLKLIYKFVLYTACFDFMLSL